MAFASDSPQASYRSDKGVVHFAAAAAGFHHVGEGLAGAERDE
jgi:hypothetical protein